MLYVLQDRVVVAQESSKLAGVQTQLLRPFEQPHYQLILAILLSSSTNICPSQAYNSIFTSDDASQSRLVGNFPLLPLRTKVRGPAYTLPPTSLPLSESPDPDDESYDPLDEVLGLFRANTFFRNFEIRGPADRLLVYGILWVSECLGKIKPGMSLR